MSQDEIPESLQRILERVARSLNSAQPGNVRVAVAPDALSVEIFLVIEKGLHQLKEIQNELGRDRGILKAHLNTMVQLGILIKQESSVAPHLNEYLVNHDDGDTGQPAIVSV
jgi:DNA-binding MarR family transcriptional regulator